MIKREAEVNGYIDLLNKTWFCLHPIDNQPCGTCTPCMQAVERGFQYRLTSAALRRYKKKKFFKPIERTFIFRGIRKIYRTLKN